MNHTYIEIAAAANVRLSKVTSIQVTPRETLETAVITGDFSGQCPADSYVTFILTDGFSAMSYKTGSDSDIMWHMDDSIIDQCLSNVQNIIAARSA